MIKLSELNDDEKVIDESGNVEDATDVKQDIGQGYYRGKDTKLYTTRKYQANIDARDVLESAIENEYCNNMYEDWNERILDDVTDEDIEKIQAILDDILSRNKEQNVSYIEDEEIDMFN